MTDAITSAGASTAAPRPRSGPLPTTPSALGHWVDRGLAVAELALDAVTRPGHVDLDAHHTSVAKVVAETAILVRVIGPSHGARPNQLADRILDLATGDSARLAIAVRASASLDQAVPYLVLREHRRDPLMDELVRRGESARAAGGRERLPHRDLELRWLRGLLTGRHDVAASDVRGTVLGAELDVLGGSRDDAYAFTHALMYATDFGRRPETVPPSLVTGLLSQARSALAGALDDEDWDLAGELLMTWPLLGAAADSDAAVALAVVLEMAEAVGTLPSATLGTVDLGELTGVDRADAIVLSTYHTAYVLALLAALAPLVTWPCAEPALSGASLRDAWLFLAGRPTWHDLAYAARPGTAGLAVALVSDARIRRLARDRRFADLAATLALPGIPSTPASLQALELFDRLVHHTS